MKLLEYGNCWNLILLSETGRGEFASVTHSIEEKTAWSHAFLIQPSYLEAQDLSQDLNNACKHVR